MIVRSRLLLVIVVTSLTLSFTGCSDSYLAGPLKYVENDALTKDIQGKANLAGKSKLQDKVRKALVQLFGASPQEIKVPEGAGLFPGGGIRLANFRKEGEGTAAKIKKNVVLNPATQEKHWIAGGYGLYRRHCLHCHGVSGAGDGPTAAFLYPLPRDYRKGLFKFTSTPNGARPHRDDLRRTIRNGLHGTSMPAFEALISEDEIEQLVDYVIFLSIRGETELALIEEGSISDENDPEALSDDIVKEAAQGIFNKWKSAQTQVVNPPVARTPSSRESILRGRELFLGKTKEKLECAGCHGSLAMGDGPSFVSQATFNQVVFGGNPSEMKQRIDQLDPKIRELWGQKLDEWGNPLRPANLNRGLYKGGRRPIDIYWRIAKGITGAQMPAHYPTINHEQIWDLVNFVLELPYEPTLLTEVKASPTTAAGAGAVANR